MWSRRTKFSIMWTWMRTRILVSKNDIIQIPESACEVWWLDKKMLFSWRTRTSILIIKNDIIQIFESACEVWWFERKCYFHVLNEFLPLCLECCVSGIFALLHIHSEFLQDLRTDTWNCRKHIILNVCRSFVAGNAT